MTCKNTDTINKIEAELYKKFPNLSERENFFMCKGKLLNKFLSFEKCGITNGDVILLNHNDTSGVFN